MVPVQRKDALLMGSVQVCAGLPRFNRWVLSLVFVASKTARNRASRFCGARPKGRGIENQKKIKIPTFRLPEVTPPLFESSNCHLVWLNEFRGIPPSMLYLMILEC
jgi:hypothetical protein